eukprot:54478_1
MHADELEINKNVARFTIIILTCIYVLILTPLSLYYAHKLWTLNTHNISFVTKRHPRIVIFSVLLFNVYAIIIRPICDISYLSGLDLGLFGAFLSNLGQIGIIMIIIALRVWLLFYDHKHQTRTLAIKWQTQVTGQENKIPWTTKYKYLGNVRILLYICVISSVIVLAIKMVFYVLFGAASLIYATMIIAGFFMVFLSFLIFNVRSVRDGFFVQKELKLILMWMMFMGVIYGGVIAPLINPISNLYILIMNIWTSQGLYVFSLVPTYWVLKQYEKQLSLNSLKKKKKIKIEDEKSNSTQNSRKIQVEYTDKMSLEEILKTKDGFDIFANHLIREFSIENLFFVFEVMQAKNEVITKKLINKFDAGVMISIDIQRMAKTRRINHNEINDVNDLRKTWGYIMEQYIKSNAEFPINISSNSRIGINDSYNLLEGGGKLVVEAAIVIPNDIEIIGIDSDEDINENNNENNDRISVDFGKMNDQELIKSYIVV